MIYTEYLFASKENSKPPCHLDMSGTFIHYVSEQYSRLSKLPVRHTTFMMK